MSKTEEIEHKYLVNGISTQDKVLKQEKMEVKYGPDDLRARRITDVKTGETYYEATVKSPTGFGKAIEEDMNNPKAVFEKMSGDIHEKTRSYIRDNDVMIVVDVFQSGPNKGFMLAEIERVPGKRWPPKNLPEWLGQDVTGFPQYFSKNIFTEKIRDKSMSGGTWDTPASISTNKLPETEEVAMSETEEVAMSETGKKGCIAPPEYIIRVYLDDGRVAEYSVSNEASVREHAAAIVKDGYRHNDGQVFEHYPPHRIMKVKCVGSISTKYPSVWSGT